MKKANYWISAVFAVMVLALGVLLPRASVSAIADKLDDEEDKVTICHRTNSASNPYIKITVDESAVDGQGNNDHTQHTGSVATSESVAQSLKDNKQKWGDIIPSETDGGVGNGLNWDSDGQAVYNNNCGNGENELEAVVPAVVTFTDATCTVSGYYTVPTSQHVTYSVNGATVSAGNHNVNNGTTVTVVAVADQGYYIADETTDTWTHEFKAASGCGQVLSSSTQVTQTPKGAVNAGAGGASVLTSLFGLIGSLGLISASVFSRKWSNK